MLQQSVTDQIVVGVRSFSKVFVGEIVEEGASSAESVLIGQRGACKPSVASRGRCSPIICTRRIECVLGALTALTSQRWRASDEPSTHVKRKFAR